MSKQQSAVTKHLFDRDETVPADPISGKQVCRCGLLGVAGDAHHTMPDPIDDVQTRAAGDKES